MSRPFRFKIEIEGHNPAKTNRITEVLDSEDNFDMDSVKTKIGGPQRLFGQVDTSLTNGRTPEDYITALAVKVWAANDGLLPDISSRA
jgi:hypothetical protein